MITKLETFRIRQIVEFIKENADELKEEKNRSEYEEGELLAYAEVLTIIKDTLIGHDVEKEIGLDFDIEKRYLGVIDSRK